MLSEATKKQRINKITSSVSAAVLGVDEDASPLDAWLKITGQDDGEPESPEQAKAFERGNVLERVTLEYGAERLGRRLVDAPFRVHDQHDWLADSADGLYIGDKGIDLAEAKTVALGRSHLYGEEMTDEVPMHALVQSHHHMMCWPDVDTCWVPTCVGGYEFAFKLYRVDRNPELETILLDKLGEWFHRYVSTGTPPPATAKDTEFLVKRFAGRVETEPLAPTDEIRALAIDKMRAAAQRKDAEEAEDTAKNRLRALLGHHEECRGDGWKVTWRQNKPSAKVDHEALANHLLAGLPADEAEALIREYAREKPGNRPLNVWLSKAMRKELGL